MPTPGQLVAGPGEDIGKITVTEIQSKKMNVYGGLPRQAMDACTICSIFNFRIDIKAFAALPALEGSLMI